VFLDSNATWLELIDGGSNLEAIPFGPLFVRAREVDVIVAVDGSADTSNDFPKSIYFSVA
jgi:lysophospholipase